MAKAKKHDLVYLLIAITIVAMIVSFITVVAVVLNDDLVITGYRAGSNNGKKQALPIHISKSYAICDQRIITEFGNKITSKVYDNISSRYEPKRGLHLLYAKIEVDRGNDIEQLHIICEIFANSNRLRSFLAEPIY